MDRPFLLNGPVGCRAASLRRGGYSLIEVLIVLLVISIVAGIAIPSYRGITHRARAAAALADVQAVRVAAYTYHVRTNQWPAEANKGIVPPELESYLGPGFSFERDHYQLDWDNTAPEGVGGAEAESYIGISVIPEDGALGTALLELLGQETVAVLGERFTFDVSGTLGPETQESGSAIGLPGPPGR